MSHNANDIVMRNAISRICMKANPADCFISAVLPTGKSGEEYSYAEVSSILKVPAATSWSISFKALFICLSA